MSEPLRSIVDEFVCGPDGIDPLCPRCGGCGTVCENHPDMPWEPLNALGCGCGAGMPCAGPFGPDRSGDTSQTSREGGDG